MLRDFLNFWKFIFLDVKVAYQTHEENEKIKIFEKLMKEIWEEVKHLEVEWINKEDLENRIKERMLSFQKQRSLKKFFAIQKNIKNNKYKAKLSLIEFLHQNSDIDKNTNKKHKPKKSRQQKIQEIKIQLKIKIVNDFVQKLIVKDKEHKDQISVKLLKIMLQPPRQTNFMSQEDMHEEEKQYISRIASMEVSSIHKVISNFIKKVKKKLAQDYDIKDQDSDSEKTLVKEEKQPIFAQKQFIKQEILEKQETNLNLE